MRALSKQAFGKCAFPGPLRVRTISPNKTSVSRRLTLEGSMITGFDYWTALVLGLVGSLHCAGMCGPLALALPQAGGNALAFGFGRVTYNLGRVSAYCILGLLFGLVGRSLFLAGVQRWVSIALG